MLTGILLSVLAAVMWTGNACAYSLVSRKRLPIVPFYALATAIGSVSAAAQVRWKIVLDGRAGNLAPLALIIVVCSIVNGAAVLLVLKAFRCGHHAVTWTLAQMAMVIYFLFSLLYWGEPASVFQWAGLCLVLGAMAMLAPSGAAGPGEGASQRDPPWHWLAFVMPAVLLTGMAQILFLIPSHWENGDPAGLRVFILLGTASLLAFGLSAVRGQRVGRPMVGPAFLVGICGSTGLRLSAVSGDILAPLKLSGLVYPISTVGTVILFAFCSRFLLRERFTAARWAGVALGIVGMVLIGLRGRVH